MSMRRWLCSRLAGTAALLAMIMMAGLCSAQNNGNLFNNRAVGGVFVSADGVLGLAPASDRLLLRDELLKTVGKPPAELNKLVGMRKVSLKALEAALAADPKNLSDDLRYLAGIQRIQYVLVYPEQNDIVLAGPGEGWKVNDSGDVVGVTTGLPVVNLEDLVVAFRTVENARRGGITCSIDPTEEGLRNYQQVVSKIGRMQPGVVGALEQAMGPQKISVTGVSDSSHFARVLVAADYRMKRYAMELDKAPVSGLPSFVGMLKSKKQSLANSLPRWWLACNYEPLAKSEDSLAWELRGPGVKVMTEDDFVEDGKVKRSGKSSPAAQQWADAFTEKYPALSVADPVFGELRNIMDLCVIAALIEREGMFDQVKLSAPHLRSDKESLEMREFNPPKQVSTKCSVTKSGRDFIITASGGVSIESWQVLNDPTTDDAVGKLRDKAAPQDAANWWWN